MSQRKLTEEEVEDETLVDEVVAPAWPVPPEKWAAMTSPFHKQAKHHKKPQAAHAANKASTGPQTSPKKETNVTAQEQPLVD
jgi:hypothetical protein